MGVRETLDKIIDDFVGYLKNNDKYSLLAYSNIKSEDFIIIENNGSHLAYWVPEEDKFYITRGMLKKTYLAASKKRGKYTEIPLSREDMINVEENARKLIMHEIAHKINRTSGLFDCSRADPITASTCSLDTDHGLSFALLSREIGGYLPTTVYSNNRLEDFPIFSEVKEWTNKNKLIDKVYAELSCRKNGKEPITLVNLNGSGLSYSYIARELTNRNGGSLKDFGNEGVMLLSDDDGILVKYNDSFYVSKISFNNGVLGIKHGRIDITDGHIIYQ